MELCELLHVVYDQENPNLKEMKQEAKKMIEEQSLNGTTVSVINSNTLIFAKLSNNLLCPHDFVPDILLRSYFRGNTITITMDIHNDTNERTIQGVSKKVIQLWHAIVR